jgi:hypothetical protein
VDTHVLVDVALPLPFDTLVGLCPMILQLMDEGGGRETADHLRIYNVDFLALVIGAAFIIGVAAQVTVLAKNTIQKINF